MFRSTNMIVCDTAGTTGVIDMYGHDPDRLYVYQQMARFGRATERFDDSLVCPYCGQADISPSNRYCRHCGGPQGV